MTQLHKPGKVVLYLFLVCVCFSLALAVSVTPDKTDFSTGDVVSLSVTECTGNSILQVVDAGGRLVDIQVGAGNRDVSYNTQSSNANGAYTVNVNCVNGAAETQFCVNQNGCIAPEESGTQDDGGGSGSSSSSSSGGGRSGGDGSGGRHFTGGGNRRLAENLSARFDPQETEEITCPEHSTLIDGKCVCDEGMGLQGTRCVQLAQTSSSRQDSQVRREVSGQQPSSFSFGKVWEEHSTVIIAVPSGIVFLVLLFFIIHYFMGRHGKKNPTYSPQALENWIGQERKAGSNNQEILEILEDHTGWKKDHLVHMFPTLAESGNDSHHISVAHPPSEVAKAPPKEQKKI